MIKITRHNYEAYLLDAAEGNLSLEMTAELLLFFENHPQLKEDIDSFEELKLTPLSTGFDNKEDLKKGTITAENYEQYLVAEIEGESTTIQSEELSRVLTKNKRYQKEFEFYKKTKLVAPEIVFNGKEQLKRKERKIIPLYWWASSAAAILLGFFLLNGVFDKEVSNTKTIVNHTEKKTLTPQKEVVFIKEATPPKTTLTTEINNDVTPQKRQKTPIKKDVKAASIDTENLNELIAEKDDSTNVIAPQKIEEEPVLLANNVRITYEEEPVVDNAVTAPQKKKKKRLFKKIFNSQVRDKVREKVMRKEVNESGEIVAYALTVGGVNLYRKEIK